VKLTLREKRFIFAGIIVVVVVLILYAAASVMGDRESLTQEVERNKQLLLKQREILNSEEGYKKRVEQYTRRLEQELTRLLPGDNSSIASAGLQTILKDFADQSGVEITQKTTLPEKKVPDNEMLTKISVRIETNCNLEQLVDFLVAIENYDKFLKVEELIITSLPTQRRYQIRPSLTVAGYISSPNLKPTEGSTTKAGANQQSSSIAQK
jgi:hypothetical protein